MRSAECGVRSGGPRTTQHVPRDEYPASSIQHPESRFTFHASRTTHHASPRHPSLVTRHASRGFTMIEIAISLAVIGFALVAIIGILPTGLNVQKDNREETIIGHDAGILMDVIRNGEQGLDDLVNYVVAITNSVTLYKSQGS